MASKQTCNYITYVDKRGRKIERQKSFYDCNLREKERGREKEKFNFEFIIMILEIKKDGGSQFKGNRQEERLGKREKAF